MSFLGTTGAARWLQNLKANLDLKANIADLASVATSGSYNDLSNKPTIGNATVTDTAFDGTTTTFTTNQASAGSIGKAMTADQLAAVNSGITADKLAALATTSDVESKITAAKVGAATFQGVANSESDISGTSYATGYYWVVNTAGTYFGEVCEAGDMIFAISDKGDSASDDDFAIVQNNIVEMTTSEVDAAFTTAGLSIAS